jgi:hypothetical protein
MNALPIALSVFLVGTVQSSAMEPAFEPVGQIVKFDFDTPDGHYEEWNQDIVCPVNALRATVHFTRYGMPTTQFQPGVNAYLLSGEGNKIRLAKIGFHAMAFRPPFLVTMEAGDSKAAWQKLTLARQTGDSNWFSFQLVWSPDGTASGSADGQVGTVSMRTAPQRIHLLGFSGAGEVSIQLGYLKSNDRNDACRPVA